MDTVDSRDSLRASEKIVVTDPEIVYARSYDGILDYLVGSLVHLYRQILLSLHMRIESLSLNSEKIYHLLM